MADRCSNKMRMENCTTCTDRHEDWFCNLSPQALVEFDALGMHMMVPSGGTLFFEAQPARGVYVLCKGHVKLTTSSKDGKTFLMRIAKPGDVLGLSATISDTAYSTTAQALDPVQVKAFQSKDFLHFIEHHSEGSMHAAKMLNRKYRDALSTTARLVISASISGRIASMLLEMATERNDPKLRFTMLLTHEELASMLGTTRETVTRMLNEMKHKEIIAIHGASITILRKDVLELLV